LPSPFFGLFLLHQKSLLDLLDVIQQVTDSSIPLISKVENPVCSFGVEGKFLSGVGVHVQVVQPSVMHTLPPLWVL
jgi:hypothetical protein